MVSHDPRKEILAISEARSSEAALSELLAYISTNIHGVKFEKNATSVITSNLMHKMYFVQK
jgi:hypothetical protein